MRALQGALPSPPCDATAHVAPARAVRLARRGRVRQAVTAVTAVTAATAGRVRQALLQVREQVCTALALALAAVGRHLLKLRQQLQVGESLEAHLCNVRNVRNVRNVCNVCNVCSRSENRSRHTSSSERPESCASSTARCIFFSCQLRLRRGARPSSDCACGARDAHDAVCGRWCANLRNACDSRDAHRSVPRARGLARSRPLLGGWMRRRTRRRSRSRGSSRAPRPPPRPRASSTD